MRLVGLGPGTLIYVVTAASPYRGARYVLDLVRYDETRTARRTWMNEIALRLAARLFDQPLIQNQYRSAFVEAMIEPYLARSGWRYVGDNWAGWDFEHEIGTRLELKQSAAWQTWDP